MLHWSPTLRLSLKDVFSVDPAEREPAPVAFAAAAWSAPSTPRAEHARMLDHAARRRRAACDPGRREDRGYWSACAPAAVAKARSLRRKAAFAALP